VGISVGVGEGISVGAFVGISVGAFVGICDGVNVGNAVGELENHNINSSSPLLMKLLREPNSSILSNPIPKLSLRALGSALSNSFRSSMNSSSATSAVQLNCAVTP